MPTFPPILAITLIMMVKVSGESIGQDWQTSVAHTYHLQNKTFSLRIKTPIKSIYSREKVIPPKENGALLEMGSGGWVAIKFKWPPQGAGVRALIPKFVLYFTRPAWYRWWFSTSGYFVPLCPGTLSNLKHFLVVTAEKRCYCHLVKSGQRCWGKSCKAQYIPPRNQWSKPQCH